jgi:hypothetical protein
MNGGERQAIDIRGDEFKDFSNADSHTPMASKGARFNQSPKSFLDRLCSSSFARATTFFLTVRE